MRNGTRVRLTLLCSVLMMLLACMAMARGTRREAKNGGVVPDKKPVAKAVSGDITGERVVAIVDYPSGSDCIRVGYTGVCVCYDPADPVLPYLIDWDQPCGFPQSQVCGVVAENGWWVHGSEIDLECTGPCCTSQIMPVAVKAALATLLQAVSFAD